MKKELSEPKIHDETLLHVTRGQNLTVDCTVEVDVAMRYVFDWNTPQVYSDETVSVSFEFVLQREARETLINDALHASIRSSVALHAR